MKWKENQMNRKICIPPGIKEYFDYHLLGKGVMKCGDDSSTLKHIYGYLKTLKRKCLNHPNRLEKFISAQEKFLELYERITTKETEFKEKTGEDFQRPFDYFPDPDKRRTGLFGKIKNRSYFT